MFVVSDSPTCAISKAFSIRMRAQSVGRFDRFVQEGGRGRVDEDEKELQRRSSFVHG
ncbi:hypothetical protein AA0113_g5839 [Alternaria arborescens]|uniref:Uncharacterized protein n=1 Tax=Alternaria arborescens TaxID=156630 RepID=A0A4Q4S4C7_9PLEO|nr:hypothetical protein AA0111_g2819 [Alternaria arborescens]RYN29198.1 hypothetical protein AA0112_g7272 [Alternaria arborescens]RYO36502.1 hypothetical protein AA0111_g2819 [Alternaria arborescens]RYO64777.1 hypothetical protein AA0113_g5839 [Alternaria arborescens]